MLMSTGLVSQGIMDSRATVTFADAATLESHRLNGKDSAPEAGGDATGDTTDDAEDRGGGGGAYPVAGPI